MITDAVNIIGGQHVCIHGLMGPGIDPHLYKARESDAHKIAHADLIFYNGLHLEGKMTHVFKQLGSHKKSVALGEHIAEKNLLTTQLQQHDPHIWHNVQLWMQVVEEIKNTLALHDPAHAQEYERNAQAYLQQLRDLHESVKQQLQTIAQEKRILVTAHDAFSYFGHEYGLQVIALQGVSTDGEIGTHDIQNLVDFLVEKKITTIFVESAISPRSLQAVQAAATARGTQICLGDELYSDALSDAKSSAHSYVGMIRHNVQAIVNGLQYNKDLCTLSP